MSGILELFEHRRQEDSDSFTLLNLFNFEVETSSGLPLARLDLEDDGSYDTHIFPLFFVGREVPPESPSDGPLEGKPAPGSHHFVTPLAGLWTTKDGEHGFVLPPLVSWATWNERGHDVYALCPLSRFSSDAAGSTSYAFPFYFAGETVSTRESFEFFSAFYGSVRGGPEGEDVDHYLPLLASHWGSTPSGHAIDILWPLGHESEEGTDRSCLRALPFYDEWRSESGRAFGVGSFLYRRHEDFASESVSHWFLFPLGHWKSSPRGVLAWAIPGFYRRDEEEADGGYVRRTIVLPSFVSYANKEVLKSRSVPLGPEPQATEAVVDPGNPAAAEARPILETTSSGIHLWPFFGHDEEGTLENKASGLVRREEKETHSTLYPFFRIETRREAEGAAAEATTAEATPKGLSIHAPWPLVEYAEEGDSTDFRLFPCIYAGDAPERSYAYLWPLLAVEDGPAAKAKFGYHTSLVRWYSDAEEDTFHIFPAIFRWSRTRDEGLSIASLFYLAYLHSGPWEGQFHLLPLLFSSWTDRRTKFMVLPLFFHTDEDREDGGYEHSTYLLPSYYSYETKRVWKDPPPLRRPPDSGHESTVPGEWAMAYSPPRKVTSASGLHLWPFFGYHEDESLEDVGSSQESRVQDVAYSTLFPFFKVETRSESKDASTASAEESLWVHAPWPIVRYKEERDSTDFLFFPSIYAGDAPGRSYTYLWPLLAVEDGPTAKAKFGYHTSLVRWYSDAEEDTFHIFPAIFRWSRTEDEGLSIASLFYLAYLRSGPSDGWFHFLPLGYGKWNEDRLDFGLFPLYLHRDSGKEAIDYWNPSRFLFLWNTFEGKDEFHWSFFWKLVERTSAKSGDGEFRILHRLFVDRSVEGQHELTLNPFFSNFEDERTGKSSFSILKFVYRSDTEDGETTRRVFFIPISRTRADSAGGQ